MEYKSLPLEVDSIDQKKGTAVIAHAVYENLDLVKDISTKGMFTKSWKEKTLPEGGYDVSFYVNHDDTQAPGKVIRLFDNEEKAFTEVKMGTHTLGKDTLIQMEEGIIRKASFGFNTIKAVRVESKAARRLKEVDHLETSVLTRLSANPKAGIISVTKQLAGNIIELKQLQPNEQAFVTDMIGMHTDQIQKLAAFAGALPPESDLYSTAQYWLGRVNDLCGDMKSQIRWNGVYGEKKELSNPAIIEHIARLKGFVRNTKASDACIQEMELEIKSLEQTLEINTADTPAAAAAAHEPSVSETEVKALSQELVLLAFKHL